MAKYYTPPHFELIELEIEQGFAQSFSFGDPGGAGPDPDYNDPGFTF